MDVIAYMSEVGQKAREAATQIVKASTHDKNQALLATAEFIDQSRQLLVEANQQDLENGRANGLDAALLDRLELTQSRIDTMIEGLNQVAALPDPVGVITDMAYR
ncbi:MAG: gamma-glutamyl-phosphate reductase, partial [Pseudomonadales bacterium]|nr:gamma-glutamyl-phosphate reductase [Pseudomonadales bacterium]